jgi:hypothetical protein
MEKKQKSNGKMGFRARLKQKELFLMLVLLSDGFPTSERAEMLEELGVL